MIKWHIHSTAHMTLTAREYDMYLAWKYRMRSVVCLWSGSGMFSIQLWKSKSPTRSTADSSHTLLTGKYSLHTNLKQSTAVFTGWKLTYSQLDRRSAHWAERMDISYIVVSLPKPCIRFSWESSPSKQGSILSNNEFSWRNDKKTLQKSRNTSGTGKHWQCCLFK